MQEVQFEGKSCKQDLQGKLHSFCKKRFEVAVFMIQEELRASSKLEI